MTYEKAPFCSGATRYQTTPSMLTETQVMTEQLKALESTLMNDLAKAEAHLKRSVELEENLSYSYGPPVIQKPTHELYADWLRQQGRTEEAKEQYSKTLVRAPKRKIATSRMQQAPEA